LKNDLPGLASKGFVSDDYTLLMACLYNLNHFGGFLYNRVIFLADGKKEKIMHIQIKMLQGFAVP
jgi:hypothetical protein